MWAYPNKDANVKELHDADSKAWGTLKTGGPILGIYGKDDTSPSPKDAEKWQSLPVSEEKEEVDQGCFWSVGPVSGKVRDPGFNGEHERL